MEISHHAEVDARGLRCPLPILRAKKGLAALGPGQVLRITTTDPYAARDFKAFCQQTGHKLLMQQVLSAPAQSEGESPNQTAATAASLDPQQGLSPVSVTVHWIAKHSKQAPL